MLTKELVKGQRIRLRNGWDAVLTRKPGATTAEAKVFGHYTEIGSVYCHDIAYVYGQAGGLVAVGHTPAQVRCRQANEFAFGP